MLPYFGDERFKRGFPDKAGDAHLPAVVGNRHVEEIKMGSETCKQAAALVLSPAPFIVSFNADGNGAGLAHGLASFFDQFADQAPAVFGIAAIGIGPAVEFGIGKLGQQVSVGRIDIDDVETRLPGAERRRPVPLAKRADVTFIHALALPGVGVDRKAFRAERRFARQQIGGAQAAMPEFHAGQSSMTLHAFHHQRHIAHIAVVPKRNNKVLACHRNWDGPSSIRC